MAEGPVTLTLKGGRDYDAPWLVLSAPTADDLYALAGDDQVLRNAIGNAVQRIAEANVLDAVKEKLGATPSGPPEPPVKDEKPATQAGDLASPAQIKVAAKKSGKTEAELAGITVDEAKAIMKGAK